MAEIVGDDISALAVLKGFSESTHCYTKHLAIAAVKSLGLTQLSGQINYPR